MGASSRAHSLPPDEPRHLDLQLCPAASVGFTRGSQRAAPAAALSALAHAGIVALLILGMQGGKPSHVGATIERALPAGIIWLRSAATSDPHGGGGGGDGTTEPPRRAQLPGRDALTLSAHAPATPFLPVKPQEAEPLIPQIDISALTIAAGDAIAPGAVEGPGIGGSRGPGTGGGTGGGRGTGDGPGDGPGLGPGSGGQSGGGAANAGTPGLQDPLVVQVVKPAYTAGAMQARIQGRVTVECLVTADGVVTNARIVKSLDPTFGLDDQALRAARQWRFIPARLKGHPVAVVVRIDLDFNLQ